MTSNNPIPPGSRPQGGSVNQTTNTNTPNTSRLTIITEDYRGGSTKIQKTILGKLNSDKK